jgi:hypothetical protein
MAAPAGRDKWRIPPQHLRCRPLRVVDYGCATGLTVREMLRDEEGRLDKQRLLQLQQEQRGRPSKKRRPPVAADPGDGGGRLEVLAIDSSRGMVEALQDRIRGCEWTEVAALRAALAGRREREVLLGAAAEEEEVSAAAAAAAAAARGGEERGGGRQETRKAKGAEDGEGGNAAAAAADDAAAPPPPPPPSASAPSSAAAAELALLREWKGTADVVVASCVLPYVPPSDLGATVRCLAALVRPGTGRLVHSEWWVPPTPTPEAPAEGNGADRCPDAAAAAVAAADAASADAVGRVKEMHARAGLETVSVTIESVANGGGVAGCCGLGVGVGVGGARGRVLVGVARTGRRYACAAPSCGAAFATRDELAEHFGDRPRCLDHAGAAPGNDPHRILCCDWYGYVFGLVDYDSSEAAGLTDPEEQAALDDYAF